MLKALIHLLIKTAPQFEKIEDEQTKLHVRLYDLDGDRIAFF